MESKFERPSLITFDIFGTVLNWSEGLSNDLRSLRFFFDLTRFNDVIDYQGVEEQKRFRRYAEITSDSLVEKLGLDAEAATKIAHAVGNWPLFSDSANGLRELMSIAPCVAMSNSDREHGEQVISQLGFKLSHWFCAEDIGVYKPNPEFWKIVSQRLNIPFSKRWWHVSAYADYDLSVAGELGLFRVFVSRNHCRPGDADLSVNNLQDLARSFY